MTRRLLAGVMIGALVALPLACGDDDDASLGGPSDSPVESSADTEVDVVPATDASEGETAETEPADTSTADASTDDTEGDDPTEEPTGGDLDRWCELTSDLSDDPFENVDESSPAEIEAAFAELEGQMDDYVDSAPDQIRGDAETVVAAFHELGDLLETHDYDLEEVATDPAFEEVIANPEVEAASDRVDEFDAANCP